MAKDPAFLFYSKDWIQGTASFMPDEKGVYIDLLAHQHQSGGLPTDHLRLARIVGLDVVTFDKIWETIGVKFTIIDGKYFNQKLTEITISREQKAFQNKIIGKFSSILRNSGLSEKKKLEVRKQFDLSIFMNESNETLNETLLQWVTDRSATTPPPLGNANAILLTKEEEYIKLGYSKEQIQGYNNLLDWIHKNASRVSEMKEPVQIGEYVKWKNEFGIEDIKEILTSMHNWADLLKKRVNANLTFRAFMKKKSDPTNSFHKPQSPEPVHESKYKPFDPTKEPWENDNG